MPTGPQQRTPGHPPNYAGGPQAELGLATCNHYNGSLPVPARGAPGTGVARRPVPGRLFSWPRLRNLSKRSPHSRHFSQQRKRTTSRLDGTTARRHRAFGEPTRPPSSRADRRGLVTWPSGVNGLRHCKCSGSVGARAVFSFPPARPGSQHLSTDRFN